jgi:hypothetical protein
MKVSYMIFDPAERADLRHLNWVQLLSFTTAS